MSDVEKPGAGLPTWGVVATVDEPLALVVAWVTYHLAIGASQAHVFFDRPDPAAEAYLQQIEGCFVHHCGEDNWAQHWRQTRPARHQARQKYNATRIANEAPLDWVIHCDADEYVRLKRPLEWELEKVNLKAWLRLEVLERARVSKTSDTGLFDGVFRTRWDDFDEQSEGLYGPRARYFNRGVVGHLAGKACVRAGQGYTLGVHHPTEHWDAPGGTVTLPYRSSYNATLMHFDGMTPLHYLLKMMRRVLTEVSGEPVPYPEPRKAQFAMAKQHAADPAALMAFWWQVQGLEEAEVDLLEEENALVRAPAQIMDHVRTLFPELDFSVAAFDRALLKREAELIARAEHELGFDAKAVAWC